MKRRLQTQKRLARKVKMLTVHQCKKSTVHRRPKHSNIAKISCSTRTASQLYRHRSLSLCCTGRAQLLHAAECGLEQCEDESSPLGMRITRKQMTFKTIAK